MSIDLYKEWESKSGFPCYCGATGYENAADKCSGDDSGSCCAQYMLEHFIAPEDKSPNN